VRFDVVLYVESRTNCSASKWYYTGFDLVKYNASNIDITKNEQSHLARLFIIVP